METCEEMATVFAECECGMSWQFRPERGIQSVYEHLYQSHDALPNLEEIVMFDNDGREDWTPQIIDGAYICKDMVHPISRNKRTGECDVWWIIYG